MSPEERTRLLKATEMCRADKQGRLWRALILAALTTAARGGELLKLQWRDIDFERKTLHFPAEITKSGNPRTIPMSKYLQVDLEAYHHSVPEQEKTPTSLVFPLTHSAKEQGWRRLCKRARPPITDLHFHDLKHTAMTSFASPPIDLNSRQIAYMGDHKEARMSSRYEHLEMIESIRARLDIVYELPIRFSEVTLPDLRKLITKADKEAKERLAKDKIEKVAVFKVTNNDTRLTPLGYLSKYDAYELIGIDVKYPYVQLEQLVGFHKGRYALENSLGEKHLVVDPAIVSVKDVLEGLLSSQQAAQRMLDGLHEVTASV